MSLRLPLCAAVVLVAALPAAAADVYTDEASFLAAVARIAQESFECFDETVPGGSDPIVTDSFEMTIVPAFGSTVAPMGIQGPGTPSGPHPTEGVRHVVAGNTSFTNGQFALTFTFVAPVTEFGIWITDFGDYNGGVLSFGNSSGDEVTIAVNPPRLADGNEIFWGIRNTQAPFTTATLYKTTQGDGVGLDQVYFTPIGHQPCQTIVGIDAEVEAATWSGVKSLYR